uniref:Carrier domain-containing protein n=1 Tax=Ascaris lumbricoides TaxID=6252 RepID=A0A0M3HGH1_ASCLU
MTWNEDDTTSGITYKEAFSFVLHLSSIIQQSILCINGTSVIADDCIAIICGDNFLSVLSIMAVQLIDCCYCPIDCNYPVQRIDFIQSDSKSILVLNCEETTVANDSDCLNINEVFQRWRLNEGINCYRKRFNRTSNSDLAYIIYTSGSTGKPKGVCIEQQSIVNVIEYTTRRYRLGALQRCYQFTRLTFDASLAYTFGAAMNGATMCMRNENIQAMEDIRRHLPLDILHMTPVVLGTMTSDDVKSLEKHVARWSIGGDKLTAQEMSKVIENGIPLIQVYGPTEVTVFQTIANMKVCSHTSTTIGPTISNMFGYVISDDRQQLPSNVKGEFFMVGENVARGYMNLNEMSNKFFLRNPFQTREEAIKNINMRGYKSGDIVKRLPTGEMIFYERKDMQIKINGYRVELNEIENALCKHADISSCVAILQNNTIVVFYEGNSRHSEQELIGFLSQILPYYMLPSRIIHVEKFPLNQNSKVDRSALRTIIDGNISTAPGTLSDVETRILRIWCETLKKNQIGVKDNFFAMGGNSRHSEQELIELLSQILPYYMLPSRIIHVEKFPLNQNSKVDRNALRTIIDGNISTASGTLSDVETKIRRIWCETLKKNQIGVKDNFFAMGGHSLLATTVCFKIRETLHCECPVRYLFENQTVEKLAKRLFVEIERACREKIQSQRNDQWSSCGQDDRNGNNSKMAEANIEIEMSVIRKQASLNEQRIKCTMPTPKSDDHASLKYSDAKEAMEKKLPITFQQGNVQPLPCCQLQKPLLHLYSNNPDGPYLKAYETGFRIQLRIVDQSLLNKCVNRVIASHDALRTSFLAESKTYLQEIKSATESFVALRYRHEKTDLFVSNPFDSIPILCFLEEVDGH